jgi:hypothetical protein
MEDCSLVASPKGRLCFFKDRLQSKSTVHENVRAFIICLSILDAGNKVSTNFPTLRSLLYNARRFFPNARLGVVQGFSLADFPSEKRAAFKDFLVTIEQRVPAGCELLQTPAQEDEALSLHSRLSELLASFL